MASNPDSVSFTVPGVAVPKQSFRATRNGGYQPARVTAWADTVGYRATSAMQGRAPMAGPVAVTLIFELPGRKRADNDNLSKNVLDGMKKVVFEDDVQVMDLHIIKRLGSKTPCVQVDVRTVTE